MVTTPTPGQSRHGYHINFAKQPLTSNCSTEKVLQVLRVSNVGKATQSMSPPVRDTAAEVGYFVFIIELYVCIAVEPFYCGHLGDLVK